jgi:hypothetical protein
MAHPVIHPLGAGELCTATAKRPIWRLCWTPSAAFSSCIHPIRFFNPFLNVRSSKTYSEFWASKIQDPGSHILQHSNPSQNISAILHEMQLA